MIPTRVHRHFRSRFSQRGFTLVELMIVVAIIGILLRIAVPMYGRHVRRAALNEAPGQLSQYKMAMEQWYQDNRTYSAVGAATTCGVTPPASGAVYFTYSCTINNNGQGFVATATGSSTTVANGYSYSIGQGNNQTMVAPAGSACVTGTTWNTKC